MNDNLRKKLKEKGVTPYSIGKTLGVSSAAIKYKLEEKDLSKQYYELKVFADACDCSIEDIIDEPKKKK